MEDSDSNVLAMMEWQRRHQPRAPSYDRVRGFNPKVQHPDHHRATVPWPSDPPRARPTVPTAHEFMVRVMYAPPPATPSAPNSNNSGHSLTESMTPSRWQWRDTVGLSDDDVIKDESPLLQPEEARSNSVSAPTPSSSLSNSNSSNSNSVNLRKREPLGVFASDLPRSHRTGGTTSRDSYAR
eukprot:PhM_4_TR1855/c0_g1_i3/m.61542